MKTLWCYNSKYYVQRFGILFNVQAIKYVPRRPCNYYSTTVYPVDVITSNATQTQVNQFKNNRKSSITDLNQQYFMESDSCRKEIEIINTMTADQLDTIFTKALAKNEHQKLELLIRQCDKTKRLINRIILLKLFQTFSFIGNVNMIILLQNYSFKLYPELYSRNGEYKHYLARAQCMKGNSEQGLILMQECYCTNENLRGLYRFILRELINDSVQNRSEASLVIFKRYLLNFSETWEEHYPLVCFWHICWASTWFSDQMLSNELMELSEPLRNIIVERSPAFSINILRNEYNEDAVVRLLQVLLKYKTMVEYTKVLQILFGHKLRNRDIRGCREIVHNCEALGIALPSDQQGKYIKMLINKDGGTENKLVSSDFKLKF